MPKISNTTEYPKLTSGTISTDDFLIGTRASDNATRNFPIGAILAAVDAAKVITGETLDNATTYQNDLLIGATSTPWVFFDGNQLNTINFVSGFDADTGTITFNSDYTPLNGAIGIIYF